MKDVESMQKLIYIHMGCHKTGTTSIQRFCHNNRSLLESHNIGYLPCPDESGRHIELNQCVLRADVARFTHSQLTPPDHCKLITNYKHIIRTFLQSSKCDSFLFSDEGLDFIRTKSELDELKELFPYYCEIVPILVLREKNEWKRSWINFLRKNNNDLREDRFVNPSSPYFLSEESWFFNIEELVDQLVENFTRVVKIDYQCNMVSRFLSEFEIRVDDEYRLNVTPDRQKTITSVSRIARRAIQGFRRERGS